MNRQADDKDREILAILSSEARIPLKALAGRIGLSRSAASERVARLERDGIIRGYRADIGPPDDSTVPAFFFVTLKKTPSLKALDQLARFPEVRRISSVSGQLDLVVEVETSSIARLNSLRDAISGLAEVEDLSTSIILRRDIARKQTL